MTQNRKETAWKKNRKFGDLHGGRMRLKCADGIFNRKHNLYHHQMGKKNQYI